jgi:hypothetical protein
LNFEEDERLYIRKKFLDRTEIFPESEAEFFFVGIDEAVGVRFVKDETRKVAQIVVKMCGQEIPAMKIK